MAEITVSQDTSIVNENSPISINFLNGNTPVVSSLHISQHFNKKHKNVLRDIQDLRSNLPKSFCGLNFEPTYIEVEQPSGGVRKVPAFHLTRDAFSLLVMGFTGPKALQWKLRYIEAFNALEAAVLENRSEEAYQRGLTEARALPDSEREAVYHKGVQEGVRAQKKRDGMTRLVKAVDYIRKGLTHSEAAKILGVSRQNVGDTLRRARALGMTV